MSQCFMPLKLEARLLSLISTWHSIGFVASLETSFTLLERGFTAWTSDKKEKKLLPFLFIGFCTEELTLRAFSASFQRLGHVWMDLFCFAFSSL